MPQQPCPNESGVCSSLGCDYKSSVIWYGKKGDKYCKKCYESKGKANKRPRGAATPGAERTASPPPAPRAPANIYKIKDIYGCRYAVPASNTASPQPACLES